MNEHSKSPRHKLSTTVAADTFSYLEELREQGEAASIAEAVDMAVARLRLVEARTRLENDTAAYFSGLSREAAAEDRRLEEALFQSARGINLDG
jgi:hypothetical protein